MADYDVRKRSLNEKQPDDDVSAGQDNVITLEGQIVNASGHKDQLQRGYGLLSICGLALSVDNAWVALGTSLTIAICTLLLATYEEFLTDTLQTMAGDRASFTNS